MNTNKPKLGQNFLVDQNATLQIVDALGDIASRTVVEIGPGRGAITSLLASRAHRLITVEFDPALARALRRDFAAKPNVEVLERDVLTVDFTSLLAVDAPAVAVGNLPYYITSPILTHLFDAHSLFSTLVLMVQREVADRVAAAPGSSDYGLLSATAQLYSEVQSLFTLPPSAFDPPPDVYSTVLRFNIRPRFAELAVEPAPFLAFLKAGFQQKRKTLANNLRAAGYEPAAALSSLAAAGIESNARAEAVPLPKMASLYKHLLPQTP
jgi:16S rRNA (adenine1518-N6/adenine1519-N6)-dimethyltransferase